MDIKNLAEKYSDYIIERRRFFHSIPELSFEEVKTTEEIKQNLESMGIEVETFPDYNGLVGTIRGSQPGKTVMLRADIDALPVEEHTGLSYASTNGNMHACGHDAHISMLLGASKILCSMKEEIKGTVKLLFQSAEESCYGAKYYVENGVLDGVDAIFGMHIWGTLDAPYFNLEAGNRMASVDNFKITVEGVSSHGSAPHLGKDAVIAASSIIMNIQTIVSRINNPLNPLVVSIGTIKGGKRFNIIANHVEMEGTIRTHSREVRAEIEGHLRNIVENTAKALGCNAQLDYTYYAAPVINEHDHINNIVRNAAVKLYGKESLTPMPKLMGSEDFSYLAENVPGFYGFIGTRNADKGYIYTNHNDKFTVDESVLHRGAALYAQFAYDFLEEKSK
ncbi:MAG: amidohydrolase [Sedimentibacter saalensis]|jgi:amidohydrolase|uniref:Amidohydrolase n=1 Tax=Sedimentibacter saalensis TaxID=130788 RepID=A0A562JK55_9FIRM|nr:amidohydrolase [Sedimentibacter saalensis]MEA5095610.1 amidohydrolase [Sedimentibacter saalensis]TWH83549.1 amidohydrolase [Sedimentibacter saalensis]